MPILPHVTTLWEIVLLGAPLLIVATTPELSTNTLHALLALTHPLPCTLDYRPYFTIHDPDL